MPGNIWGDLFCVSTFGESHGECIGAVIDGCPSNHPLNLEEIRKELQRRRPGQSRLTTARKEADDFRIVSGFFEGKTTGAPLCALIENKDQRSEDYSALKDLFRPSHADYTYQRKYQHRDPRGGGRSSARETAARVFAGALAKQFLEPLGIHIQSYVSQVGDLRLDRPYTDYDLSLTEDNEVRCPDQILASKMADRILEVKQQGDSIGGVVSTVIRGVPVGLGEPVFDRFQADLAKAMLSLPAAKGFDYGSGFEGLHLTGSLLNDVFVKKGSQIITRTNHSGGIQGGITNGMDIYFRVAFKAVATILIPQQSVNRKGEKVTVQGRGRHDPCVVPRAVPIVEAMSALVLMDHYLKRQAQTDFFSNRDQRKTQRKKQREKQRKNQHQEKPINQEKPIKQMIKRRSR